MKRTPDDAPTWKPQWMRATHRPSGFYQLDRMTSRVTLRIRPQRGPGAGRTIVLRSMSGRRSICATVDGRVLVTPHALRFRACYRHMMGRLARDQRVELWP